MPEPLPRKEIEMRLGNQKPDLYQAATEFVVYRSAEEAGRGRGTK